MGGQAGAAPSIAGAGFSALSTIQSAKGTQAADDFKAAELDRAASYGETKAYQTGATLTMRLNQTLGNIDAIRAAAHADPTSPTGVAIRQREEDIGDTQRKITVNNILQQSRQDVDDAAYLRSAGKTALLSGYLGAAGTFLGAAGKGLSGGGGGGGGFNFPAQPEDI